MATRINVRFISILAIVTLAVGMLLGGLWFLQVKNDATRNMRAGDEYMALAEQAEAAADNVLAQDLYERAVRTYGRAVHKEPGNLEFLDRMEKSLHKLRPRTRDQALEFDDMRVAIVATRARYMQQSAQAHLDYLSELFQIARFFQVRTERWSVIEEAAADMLSEVPAADPAQVYGKLYRGLARSRILSPRMNTQEEIDRAQQDLVEFLEAVPDNDLGWASLIGAQLAVARLYELDGKTRLAGEAYERLDNTIARAKAAVPDGPEVARIDALRLVTKERETGKRAAPQELADAVDRMVELASASDDAQLLAEVVAILKATNLPGRYERAIALLEDYLEQQPDQHYHRGLLAELHYYDGNIDAAQTAAERVVNAEPVTVSLLSRFQPILRQRAQSLIVDLEYRRWEAADAAARPEAMKRMIAARDTLTRLVTDPATDPLVLRAEGKIAYAAGDYEQAALKLEEVVVDNSNDYETLWYAGHALEEIGQLGLARERFEQCRLLAANKAPATAALARVMAKLGMVDQAYTLVQEILATDPDYKQASNLKSFLELRRSELAGGEIADDTARAVAAAQDAMNRDDLDAARRSLGEALEADPDNLSVLMRMVGVELRSGRVDEAREYVARAIEVRPNNRYLKGVAASIDNDDPIEAIKLYLTEYYDDPDERAVNTAIQLRLMARGYDARARRYEADGNAEEAAINAERSTRAGTEADALFAEIEQSAPDNPILLEFLFTEALNAGEYDRCEQLAARAAATDADQADGLIFKGRLQLAQQRYAQAVQTLQEATEQKHFSSLAHRLLGRAHENLGRFDEARRAYEEAYRCNPTDRFAVRWYVNLLQQTGDQMRALAVLRQARNAISNDPALIDTWLEMEAEAGDPALALSERRATYKEQPEDRLNAMRLVELLTRMTPTRGFVRNAAGEPRYTESQWKLLGAVERQDALSGVEARWASEVDEILASLQGGEDDLRLATLRANVLRSRGERPEGETLLRSFAEGRTEPAEKVQAVIALALYQANVGKLDAAVDTLETVRSMQSEEAEVDLAMAGIRYFNRQWAPALEAYERAYERRRDHQVRLSIAECQVRLSRFDEAAETVTELARADGGDYGTAMLMAEIAHGRAEATWARGQRDDARRLEVQAREALNQAVAYQPTNPAPHVRRAQWLTGEFTRTGQAALLDEAMLALNRAEKAQSSSMAIPVARAQVLKARGDHRGAIGELTRLLQRVPESDEAREMLIIMHRDNGNLPAAIALADEVLLEEPRNADWLERKGDLHVLESNIREAVNAYELAHRYEPTSRRVTKFANAALALDKPDFLYVVKVLVPDDSALVGKPILRALYARALSGLDLHDEAMAQMRIAYEEHRQRAASGEGTSEERRSWFQLLSVLLFQDGPGGVESFALDVSGGDLNALELTWLAELWMTRGPEGVKRAIELQREALAKCPADDGALRMRILFALGELELVAGNNRAAAETFEQVLAINPDHSGALNNAAYIYGEFLNEPAKARPLAERAVELSPQNANVLDTAGRVLFKVGDYQLAEEYLRNSVSITPTAESLVHLVEVLMARQNYRVAETYLRRAAELVSEGNTSLRDTINRLSDELGKHLNR